MNSKFDVVVIGSGAAGSVMAYNLASKGMKVAIVEKGKRENPETFAHNEPEMFTRLYKNRGLQTTKDNVLTIVQGSTVGGSTVINNAIWIRAKLDVIIPEWERRNAFIDKKEIMKNYCELEKSLNVSDIPHNVANKGSEVFLKGCSNMDIPAYYLKHNRKECLGCGWCNYGCKYNRKTSMLVTYIPWAEKKSTKVFDNCMDVKIVLENKRAKEVKFIRNSEEYNLRCEKVVVTAGAIGSSALLLESGIHLDGKVGRGLHILGGCTVTAEMEETMNCFEGIGLTCMAEASDDYVIESYFAPPVVFSLSLGGFFLTHFNRMSNYSKYIDAGVMVSTEPKGTVTLDKKNNAVIDLKFSPEELKRLKEGIKKLSQICFKAGALKVLPSTFRIIEFWSESDIDTLDNLVIDSSDLIIGSAHPQGGNIMSDDKNQGVVGCDFKIHGYENIYVSDTSIFPSNIMANCQATVMAVSQYASDFVSESKK